MSQITGSGDAQQPERPTIVPAQGGESVGEQTPPVEPGVTDIAEGLSSLEKSLRDKQVSRAYWDYYSMDHLQDVLFGKPTGAPEGSHVYDAWERLQGSKGDEKFKEKLVTSMRNTSERLYTALRDRVEKTTATNEEAAAKFRALDAYIRTVGVLGQAQKLHKNPYEVASSTAIASNAEVMHSEEKLALERVLSFLEKMDVEELITMIEEAQFYISMLIEEMNKGNLDAAPKARIADVIPNSTDPEALESYYQLTTAAENKSAVYRKLDLTHAGPAGEVEPVVHDNYVRLANFISGQPEAEGGPEKSSSRRATEGALWAEIVNAMDFDQKEYLFRTMAETKGIDTAKDMVNACILAGVMKKGEVERFDHEAIDPTFLTSLDETERYRLHQKDIIGKQVDRMKQPYLDSAILHFTSFNKLLASRLIDIGALGMLMNGILEFSDALKNPEHNESLLHTLGRGAENTLKNRNFWIGTAALVGGTEAIFPWIHNVISKPSESEQEYVTKNLEERRALETLRGNEALSSYFLNHYDDYIKIARKNEDNNNPNQGAEDRGTFELYPNDVEIDAETAVALGFRKREVAVATIHRLFNVSTKVAKLKNAAELGLYMERKVYPDMSHVFTQPDA